MAMSITDTKGIATQTQSKAPSKQRSSRIKCRPILADATAQETKDSAILTREP